MDCRVPEAELQSFSQLEQLDLSKNNVFGRIPEYLSPKLQVLRMDSNKLVGGVPHSLATHPSLQTLSLSQNQIERLPIEWVSLVYRSGEARFPLKTVNLAHNRLQVGFFFQQLQHYARCAGLSNFLASNPYGCPQARIFTIAGIFSRGFGLLSATGEFRITGQPFGWRH